MMFLEVVLEVVMKKFFVIFSVVLLVLLCGCEQASGGSSDVNDDGLIAQGAEGGFSWQVKRNVTVESGITNDAIAYQVTETATGKNITFGVVKMTAGSNVSYRGMVMATRPDTAFENEFWNQCLIQGSSLVTMSNALSTPSQEEDGSYSFLIAGSLTENDIKSLKDATLIIVSLNSSVDAERNTAIALDLSFQQALLRYF